MRKIIMSIVFFAFLLIAAPAVNIVSDLPQSQLLAGGDGGDYDTGGG